MRRSVSVLCSFALIIATAAAAAAAPATLLAVRCGHLLDTQAGVLVGETTVVIDGQRIREVLAGNHAPPGADQIDLSGETCLPGLIDSHTHLSDQTSPTAYTDRFHRRARRSDQRLSTQPRRRSGHSAGRH